MGDQLHASLKLLLGSYSCKSLSLLRNKIRDGNIHAKNVLLPIQRQTRGLIRLCKRYHDAQACLLSAISA